MKTYIGCVLLVIGVASTSFAQDGSSTGLIGRWTFDGNANDSAKSHNGKLINAILSTDARSGSHSVQFGNRSVNRCVHLGNADPSNSDLTIAMWIKPAPEGNGHQILMAKRDAWKKDQLRWQFVWQDIHPKKAPIPGEPYALTKEVLRFESWPDSRAEFPCEIKPDRWTHVALTYSSDERVAKCYINGREIVTDKPQTMSLGKPKDAAWVIGGTHPKDWREVYSGLIDDVSVWSRVLSSEEISALGRTETAKAESIRLRDFIDNPNTILQWNKSIADGWKMQQNICNRRIEHHKSLYGKQVMEAVPTEPIVAPQKPRKLLVLQMFFHDDTSGMQGTFLEALEAMANQTGVFEMKVIPTLTEISREELFEYDAVLVSGTNYSFLLPTLDPDKAYSGRQIGRIKPSMRYHFMFEQTPERREHGDAMRQALLEYVSNGGGLIGIGGAPRSDWPEYRQMYGCVDSDGYGTVIGQKEPKELLTDRLEVQAATINQLTSMMPSDETISVHSGVLLADPAFHQDANNTTLLSVVVDESNDGFRSRMTRINKWENQLPVSWIRDHGKGRVFYCAFDCTGRFMMSQQIQEHILAGIQYSLGDIER